MNASVSGEPFHVATYGHPIVPQARTLLLVHGAGMDGSVWATQGGFFADQGWNALSVDLPAHGRSSSLPPLTSIATMADWCRSLIEGGEYGPVEVVGHSMGGLVALELAGRFPDLVRSACLLGCSLRMPVHPRLLALAEQDDPGAFQLIVDWGFSRRSPADDEGRLGARMRDRVRQLLADAPPGVLGTDLAACANYTAGDERAKAVRCPTLVLVGEDDKMTPPAAGRALAEAIPRAQLKTVGSAGHMMMLERPDETLVAIRSFLG